MNALEIVPLTREAVAALLAERAARPRDAQRPGRRKYPRWPFAGTIEMWYTDPAGRACYNFATCENLSLGGVGIRSEEAFNPATEIAVAVHQPERTFYGRATVCHCTAVPGGYHCGLEFVCD